MNKIELWESIKSKYSHLENYCKIEVQGINDESIYYHSKFIIDENTYITSQGDVNNNFIYAFRFYHNDEINNISVEIHDSLLDNVIIGWSTNKEMVKTALSTLHKLKEHISNLNNYVNDYMINLLIGSTVNEISNNFINEIKTTNKLIDFMQTQK